MLRVHTSADSLLVAVNARDEQLWTYHADHLRRWSAEHRAQLQRWADDSKYEQRPVPARGKTAQDSRGELGGPEDGGPHAFVRGSRWVGSESSPASSSSASPEGL